MPTNIQKVSIKAPFSLDIFVHLALEITFGIMYAIMHV